MPGDIGFDSGTSYWGANLTVAVLNGTIPQWRVDDMATRIMVRYLQSIYKQARLTLTGCLLLCWTLQRFPRGQLRLVDT